MALSLPRIVTDPSASSVVSWLEAHRHTLDATLDECGALLLRGFSASDEAAFRACVPVVSATPLDYVYRSTPRTDLGGGVYTATEYPPGHTIPMHNENAYQREWPLHVLFFCDQPAAPGSGHTSLADTVAVTDRIPAAIRQRFRDRGVRYIRNYGSGVDLPWQTVFQTSSRAEVEQFCAAHDITCEWIGDESLRTSQVCQAFATHPRTRVEVWFNQAHLFHPSGLNPQTRRALESMFEPSGFPRNAAYGDGSPIDEADLAQIRDAFDAEIVNFQWHQGDVLIVDNMLVSHGRTPFKGPRRVLVAMCNPYAPAAAATPLVGGHAATH
jgi:alpha-ketoglutarate-dependent taurine dioxygenase